MGADFDGACLDAMTVCVVCGGPSSIAIMLPRKEAIRKLRICEYFCALHTPTKEARRG